MRGGSSGPLCFPTSARLTARPPLLRQTSRGTCKPVRLSWSQMSRSRPKTTALARPCRGPEKTCISVSGNTGVLGYKALWILRGERQPVLACVCGNTHRARLEHRHTHRWDLPPTYTHTQTHTYSYTNTYTYGNILYVMQLHILIETEAHTWSAIMTTPPSPPHTHKISMRTGSG